MSKSKPFKIPSAIAKDLRSGKYSQKIVPSAKVYSRKKLKSFKQFNEEGAAPATSTAGVAGAGDNPQKIVPVFKNRQTKYQKAGEKSEKELVVQLRKMMGSVNV